MNRLSLNISSTRRIFTTKLPECLDVIAYNRRLDMFLNAKQLRPSNYCWTMILFCSLEKTPPLDIRLNGLNLAWLQMHDNCAICNEPLRLKKEEYIN